MKRATQSLVSYSSSDGSDSEPVAPPPAKKKKLPALSASLQPIVPIDNPALHQGRTRSSPHVEGQFAAYIYIPVIIDTKSTLGTLVNDVVTETQKQVSGTHGIAQVDDGKKEIELHVSLSRPVFLRAHQREDLKRAVKTVANSRSPFRASFATFSELTNDEKTRTFLTLEVGAGHSEIRALTEKLTPTLRAIRQKEFYVDPRFHASIAWALLDKKPTAQSELSSTVIAAQGEILKGSNDDQVEVVEHPANSSSTPQAISTFPSIPHFPTTLVPSLIEKYGPTLTRANVASFEVTDIKVKIGKWVGGWELRGAEH